MKHYDECPVDKPGADWEQPVTCACAEIEADWAEVHAEMEMDSLREER